MQNLWYKSLLNVGYRKIMLKGSNNSKQKIFPNQWVEIRPDRRKPLTVPAELQAAPRKRKRAGTGFEKLTPGKRREYVAVAKQQATKQKRIDKILPMIVAGVGLNDKHRNH